MAATSNTNLLQIGNEFYSPIRPSGVTRSGEKPVLRPGVTRCRGIMKVALLDIDPFVALGIERPAPVFLDSFLLIALAGKPRADERLYETGITRSGSQAWREPGLQLS